MVCADSRRPNLSCQTGIPMTRFKTALALVATLLAFPAIAGETLMIQ
ncbi:MAG: hypothetical protein RL128_1119, partial [Pseudomonadota bacterium]